ncbi:MAG TPA: zf-HC2 domain-containing protein [Vicinamibacterales bacterium]|nr:zf-HC2 domain-containing protein [Vicinamibacterales bacterium]
MSCERYLDTINAYVDGTLDVVERREIEDHLAACPSCAALATDLARVKQLALSLERRTPPPGLWDRIERATREIDVPRGRRDGYVRMALAAAAVLVAAVAAAFFLTREGAGPEPPTVAGLEPGMAPVEVARTVEAELRLAEQHYENAIAGLEQLARDRQLLDPEVAATLQKNLQLIDAAIAESRSALRAQPGSHPAQQSLFDAFRTKIALLEDTIYLLSEIRRNSQASNEPASGTNGDHSS